MPAAPARLPACRKYSSRRLPPRPAGGSTPPPAHRPLPATPPPPGSARRSARRPPGTPSAPTGPVGRVNPPRPYPHRARHTMPGRAPRARAPLMRAFAELLDRLADPLAQRQAHAPRRLPARHPRPRPRLGAGGADRRPQLRRRQAGLHPQGRRRARIDPQLFGWSLRLCRRPGRDRRPGLAGPAPARQPRAGPLRGGRGPAHRHPRRGPAADRGPARRLDATDRWALLKLVTGGLRVGLSARLAKQAAADLGGGDVAEIEELWHALHPPYEDLFAWLDGRPEPDRRRPALPPGHAGPGDRRGGRLRQARPRRLRRRVEVGRHPRPGGPRGRRPPPLHPHRRRHLRRLPRHPRRARRRGRPRRRAAGHPRRARSPASPTCSSG